MKAKTEQLLYHLLFFAEQMSHPTYANAGRSFEAWAYRNGYLRRIQELERQAFIEQNRSLATGRIYRLTEKGRLLALGGQDPEARWNRAWDGKWRVLLFDLPRGESTARKRLHTALKSYGFGVLQGSVWISPDPLAPDVRKLCGRGDDVSTLISLEGEPGAGERSERIVREAWNFRRIQELHQAHGDLLQRMPNRPVRTESQAEQLLQWGKQERLSWREILDVDPLLPHALLPAGYRGKAVWKLRKATLAQAGQFAADWIA